MIFFSGTRHKQLMYWSGWTIIGAYSTTKANHILPFLFRVVCGATVIAGGVGISMWVISFFIHTKTKVDNSIDAKESERDRYIQFINKDYEKFIDIYANETEDNFTNKSSDFLKELNKLENHETYDLPYSYNSKLIFFYDHDSEAFHYFCQSDVCYKILNSACRTYTISKKCIQLFNDEEEIEYVKSQVSGESVDVSFSITEKDSKVQVEEDESEETEESEGFINIFYNKKDKYKHKTDNNVKTETNKFVYKGNIDVYEQLFYQKTAKPKETSYEEFLKLSK